MESRTSFINASAIPPSGRAGRWMPSESSLDSLVAHWCSSSLEFCFSGTKLSMVVGEETERKDRLNGGTKMIAVITGPKRDETLVDLDAWRTFDPEPNSEVVIFDGKDGVRHEKVFVRVVLIDWASKFEVKGFILDAKGSIHPVAVQPVDTNHIPPPLLLVVGDSISSGLAVDVDKGGEPLPFGCLNTFPFVAQRILQVDGGKGIGVELIGYPGFSLVHPTEKEREEGYPHGMQTAFFWESPWSRDPWAEFSSPKAVLIELGTNDQFFKITPERFGNAVIDFVDALLKSSANSIEHFWLVPPFPDADVPDARELLDAMPGYIFTLTERFGDGVSFKLCNLVEGLTVDDTVDGVHPRLRVHNELGKKLADFIEKDLYQ